MSDDLRILNSCDRFLSSVSSLCWHLYLFTAFSFFVYECVVYLFIIFSPKPSSPFVLLLPFICSFGWPWPQKTLYYSNLQVHYFILRTLLKLKRKQTKNKWTTCFIFKGKNNNTLLCNTVHIVQHLSSPFLWNHLFYFLFSWGPCFQQGGGAVSSALIGQLIDPQQHRQQQTMLQLHIFFNLGQVHRQTLWIMLNNYVIRKKTKKMNKLLDSNIVGYIGCTL